MKYLTMKMKSSLWIYLLLITLIISFLSISLITPSISINDNPFFKSNSIYSFDLSIVVIVSNNQLLRAAKDTWMLHCPFPITFRSSKRDQINWWIMNRTYSSHVFYTLTFDVTFYLVVTRLKQWIMEERLDRDVQSLSLTKEFHLNLKDILIGPLDTLRDFDRVHFRFSGSSRRAIQNSIDYHPLIDHHCVHNPLMQKEIYPHLDLPECPLTSFTPTSIQLSELSTYVITLKESNDQQILRLNQTLHFHGLTVQLFRAFQRPSSNRSVFKCRSSKLSEGECNLRETMRRFFGKMIEMKVNRVLVFEDDVLPHRQFGTRLQNLLTIDHLDRCSTHLFDNSPEGGILLLGATVWSTGRFGWRMIDEEMKKNSFQSACFNIDRVTFGAFALLIHRNTFQSILNWLDDRHYCQFPYDHVFSYLSQRGHIVRVAYPFLAIPDVSHLSSVNPHRGVNYRNVTWRSQVHRWIPFTDYFLNNLTTSRKDIIKR